jgi:hypothetical protein
MPDTEVNASSSSRTYPQYSHPNLVPNAMKIDKESPANDTHQTLQTIAIQR